MDLRLTIRSNRFPQAPALLRRAIGAGFEAARGPLLADMQRRTPVDTAALRESERAESDDQRLTLAAGGGEVDYALYVHQGARGRQGRPFMRDAVEQGAPAVAQAIVDAATRELA